MSFLSKRSDLRHRLYTHKVPYHMHRYFLHMPLGLLKTPDPRKIPPQRVSVLYFYKTAYYISPHVDSAPTRNHTDAHPHILHYMVHHFLLYIYRRMDTHQYFLSAAHMTCSSSALHLRNSHVYFHCL